MVRTVNHHHHREEENEDDDEDFIQRTSDTSSHKDGTRNDKKSTSYRSKHSETEQRRRSKINDRFQILRDLIPQNDQKKDRASFLLEVIQYIQFLQEKLQVYEGTYQGWSPESTKLMPWRGNYDADNYADQSQPIKICPVDDGNFALTQALPTNAQNMLETPDVSGLTAFKTTDNCAATTASLDLPLQQNTFATDLSHSPQGSFPDVEILNSQSRSQTCNAMSLSSESALRRCSQGGLELEEPSISDIYSKGLLNNLTQALSSSGVDLSQASISVQFDIRKRTSSGATSSSFGIKDHHDYLSPGNQAMAHYGIRSGNDCCRQPHKRPRTEQNQ